MVQEVSNGYAYMAVHSATAVAMYASPNRV